MRLLSLAVLSCLLATVYWVGATVYSDRIEQDITERSSSALARYQPGVSVSVDGRDVTIDGEVTSKAKKHEVNSVADGVWGVRKTQNQLAVNEPPPPPPPALPSFDFKADYANQQLHMSGLVDSDETVAMIENIPNALPPTTLITTGVIGTGAADLVQSPAKVETGIAALTQLNRGDLAINSTDFVLNGIVSDEERRQAIEKLIDTRKPVLDPLNVTMNIEVDPYIGVTQACREAIVTSMKNNVLNYKVDFSAIEDRYTAKLDEITSVVSGVCANQVTQVLVEGHADFTGGEGYNQGLSERRASTVYDYLVERGLPVSTVTAFGYGEFRPIASNETEEGRAMNRRTEVHLSIEAVQLSTNSDD